jgi:hypothetical protein
MPSKAGWWLCIHQQPGKAHDSDRVIHVKNVEVCQVSHVSGDPCRQLGEPACMHPWQLIPFVWVVTVHRHLCDFLFTSCR